MYLDSMTAALPVELIRLTDLVVVPDEGEITDSLVRLIGDALI